MKNTRQRGTRSTRCTAAASRATRQVQRQSPPRQIYQTDINGTNHIITTGLDPSSRAITASESNIYTSGGESQGGQGSTIYTTHNGPTSTSYQSNDTGANSNSHFFHGGRQMDINDSTQIVRYRDPSGDIYTEDIIFEEAVRQPGNFLEPATGDVPSGQILNYVGTHPNVSTLLQDSPVSDGPSHYIPYHIEGDSYILSEPTTPQLKYPKVPQSLYTNPVRHGSASSILDVGSVEGGSPAPRASNGGTAYRSTTNSSRTQSASAVLSDELYNTKVDRTIPYATYSTRQGVNSLAAHINDNGAAIYTTGIGGQARDRISGSIDKSSIKSPTVIDPINEVSPKKEVPNFIQKLAHMLEKAADKETYPQFQTSDGTFPLISWNSNDSFVIREPNKFTKDMVPAFFKSNKRESFIRQLNTYGFKKVTNIEHDNLIAENQQWEEILHYTHPNFVRDDKERWLNIKRRRNDCKPRSAWTNMDNKNDIPEGASPIPNTMETENMSQIFQELKKLSEHNKIVSEQMLKLSKDNDMLKEQNQKLFESDRKNKNNISNVVHLLSKMMKRTRGNKKDPFPQDLPELLSAVSNGSDSLYNEFTTPKAITSSNELHVDLLNNGEMGEASHSQLHSPGHLQGSSDLISSSGHYNNPAHTVHSKPHSSEKKIRYGKRPYNHLEVHSSHAVHTPHSAGMSASQGKSSQNLPGGLLIGSHAHGRPLEKVAKVPVIEHPPASASPPTIKEINSDTNSYDSVHDLSRVLTVTPKSKRVALKEINELEKNIQKQTDLCKPINKLAKQISDNYIRQLSEQHSKAAKSKHQSKVDKRKVTFSEKDTLILLTKGSTEKAGEREERSSSSSASTATMTSTTQPKSKTSTKGNKNTKNIKDEENTGDNEKMTLFIPNFMGAASIDDTPIGNLITNITKSQVSQKDKSVTSTKETSEWGFLDEFLNEQDPMKISTLMDTRANSQPLHKDDDVKIS